MSRKQLSVAELNEDAQHVYLVVNEGSDLACALIISDYLDQCLANLLSSFFISSSVSGEILDPIKGIAGSAFARNDLAYSLGLLPKSLYQNLRSIFEIRNLFAHSHLEMTFRDDDIARKSVSLTWPGVAKAVRYSPDEGAKPVEEPFSRFSDPRSKFSIIGVMAGSRVLLTSLGTQKLERRETGW